MGIKESSIEKFLYSFVKSYGGISYKISARRGSPDRLIILPEGRIFFVELKRPGGKLSPAQRFEIDRLKKLGIEVFVLSSSEEIKDLIQTWFRY